MSASINTSSGSIYPDSSLLQAQLNPDYGSMVPVESSRIQGGVAPIWSRTYTDLTRFGTLQINGTQIYAPDSPITPPQGVEAAAYVFRQMEAKLDSTSLAMRAANLMQQDTGGGILKQIALQKGISKPEGEGGIISSHSVQEKQRVVILNASQAKFTLVMESLVLQRSIDDPENGLSYFKVKTTISGPTQALELKNGHQLSIKAAYTPEKPSPELALQSDYSGTRAGLFDSASYLKA